MKDRRVVITGMGALTPIGLTLESYWESLKKGVSGANLITHFDTEHFKTKFACELKGFDPSDYFHRRDARKMDPFCQYAMVAADEAIAHSGLDLEKTDRNRIGVIVGSGIGGIQVFHDEVSEFATGSGVPRFNPFFIPKMIIDSASGNISIKHGLKGPNFAAVSACSTSSDCLASGFMMIKLGLADAMVVGGAEAAITPEGIGGFNAMKALSENNDEYERASCPFDAQRDGFVMGEGGGALIIESYEHAVARGATLYAEVAGIGVTADAYHITAPSGEGAERAMRNTMEMAGVKPEEVDHINVHATSTPVGDISESNAIKAVFGDHAPNINISATKSQTGHLLGAAGAVEAIAAVMAINHSMAPPTINHRHEDPELDLNYTLNDAQARQINVAISNTFGFGGHNTSVLFRKIG